LGKAFTPLLKINKDMTYQYYGEKKKETNITPKQVTEMYHR
jgi:hypothetical protein